MGRHRPFSRQTEAPDLARALPRLSKRSGVPRRANEMAVRHERGSLAGGVVCKVAANDPVEAEVSADLGVAVARDEHQQRRRRRRTAAFAGGCRSRPGPGPPRRRGGATAAGARSGEAVASAAGTSCLLSLNVAALSKRPSQRLHDRTRRSNSQRFRRRAAAPAQIQAWAAWAPRDCFSSVARSARAIATPRFRSRGRRRPDDRIPVSRSRRSGHPRQSSARPGAACCPPNSFSGQHVDRLTVVRCRGPHPVRGEAEAAAARGARSRCQRRLPRAYAPSGCGHPSPHPAGASLLGRRMDSLNHETSLGFMAPPEPPPRSL